MYTFDTARSWRVTPAVWDQLLLNSFFFFFFFSLSSTTAFLMSHSIRETCIHFKPVREGWAGHDGWGRW